jgi:Mitochondrial resolvase Ydc2 / RNA splicing MRS1
MENKKEMIASFDVGIRNLAYCVISPTRLPLNGKIEIDILQWDSVNLITNQHSNSGKTGKCEHGHCRKTAVVLHKSTHLCAAHGEMRLRMCLGLRRSPPSHNNHRTENNDASNKSNDAKKENGCLSLTAHQAATYQNVHCDHPRLIRMRARCKSLPSHAHTCTGAEFIENYVLVKISRREKTQTDATKCDMVTLSRSLTATMDQLLSAEILSALTTVKIENQIGPRAARMKCVQGMLTQYFVMRSPDATIQYISPTQKLALKPHTSLCTFPWQTQQAQDNSLKMSYKDRKAAAVCLCKQLLTNEVRDAEKWLRVFGAAQKRDDLADCLLQCFTE